MKATSAALLAMAFGAPAMAASIFVRDANVESSQASLRDDLTQMIRHAVRQTPGETLASDEGKADAVIQPTLSGRDGSYALRIERIENKRVVSATERSVGNWNDVADVSRQATRAALVDDEGKVADSGSVPSSGSDGEDPMVVSHAQATDASADKTDKSDASGPNAANISRVDNDAPAAANSNSNSDMRVAHRSPSADSNSENASPAPSASGDAKQTSQNGGQNGNPNGDQAGGETRGFHPISALRQSPGHWAIGAGPGFGIGMGSGNIMYSVTGGYLWDLNPRFSVKALGEADLGSGADNARLLDAAVGVDAFLNQTAFTGSAKPYVTADVGLGAARNQQSQTESGLSLGAGAGFRFASVEKQNLDVLLHYKLLAADLAGATPSVFGVRAALNF